MEQTILSLTFIFFSAVFRSLDQIMRWNQEKVTWLPDIVWTWKICEFKTFDAVHFYMGLKITLLAIGVHILPTQVWYVYLILWFGYYQVFNLFFHVIWKLNL
jgi:hypothetical protein